MSTPLLNEFAKFQKVTASSIMSVHLQQKTELAVNRFL
jgi:hypothetical protein